MARSRSERLTIADIAQMAGVSKSTVSRVLNDRSDVDDETRARVKRLLEETGFARSPVATALAGGTTRSIGVIFPHVSTSWTAEILLGIGRTVYEAGYDLMLWTIENSVFSMTQVLGNLRSGLIAGAVVVLPQDAHGSELEPVIQQGYPLIAVDYRGSVTGVPAIQVKNKDGMIDAMAHLIALGHRRIGLIAGNPIYGCSLERLAGYQSSLASHGIPVDPDLITMGNFREQGGYDAASRLMQLAKPPTAIMAANDLSAIGAMRALKAFGYAIPRDVSIVGFDDISAAQHTDPPLTTVRQPMQQMGALAATMIVECLRGERAAPQSVELETELVLRHSTAPPPPEGTRRYRR